MTVAPESAAGLTQKLADEQARSAALAEQLAGLTGQTTELTAALTSASDRITSDAKSAKTLRDKLAGARKKLAAMNRAAQQAAVRPAPAKSSGSSSGGGGGGGGGGDGGEPGDG